MRHAPAGGQDKGGVEPVAAEPGSPQSRATPAELFFQRHIWGMHDSDAPAADAAEGDAAAQLWIPSQKQEQLPSTTLTLSDLCMSSGSVACAPDPPLPAAGAMSSCSVVHVCIALRHPAGPPLCNASAAGCAWPCRQRCRRRRAVLGFSSSCAGNARAAAAPARLARARAAAGAV